MRAEYSSQGFSGESLPAALQGFQPSSKTCCCGCRQPVNSRQLLETSQKAKAFQDTQRLWPTAQGAGNALCSQLPFRFCALGAWQWPNHVGTWCGGPGAGAPPVGSSRMLISPTQLGFFFFHFSFSWGWDSPPGKRTGKPGKPQLIRPSYLDCSHWLPPRTLQSELDGGTEWEAVVMVVVDQQWKFFPKAYARGPSQLWLCSGTLLPTSCGPRRPALLTETSVLSGTICRVFSLLSSHSSLGFSSTSCPCRVGHRLPVLLRVSPARCALQLVVYLAPRCRDLARAGPGGATRVCLPPPSCRVGRRQDPAAWKAEFPIYPRSTERSGKVSALLSFPHSPSKLLLALVNGCVL